MPSAWWWITTSPPCFERWPLYCLLTGADYFVLEYSFRRTILYWNIPTDWIFCTRTFLPIEYLVLECPQWLTILYWNILTDWIFCTGISLSTDYFVLEHSYWLNILY
jgi:hypothetical protein